MAQTLFWHDYETSGADTRRDRPMQFAGIRTDLDLNIIEEPVNIYCKPADDFLPHPKACLITGITPQEAMEKGVVEADFIAQVNEELSRAGTCGIGYNSLRFDDEITRNTLYRNFADPYAREWQNDCSRWDIIDMLRLTRALRPEGIEWPKNAEGYPSLRLEDLTVANGIDHGQAHDALSDVHATIGMAKLVKERQPRLYDFVFENRTKRAVQAKIDLVNMKPVLHVSSRYAVEHGNLAVVAPICNHPTNKNGVIVWDLREDPAPLMDLSVEELNKLLYTRRDQLPEGAPRIALKQVHINKCPIIAPAGMLNTEEAAKYQIDGAQCRAHLNILRNMGAELIAKLHSMYAESGFDEPSDPDLMIYSGGFFGDTDKKSMDQIRRASPDVLAESKFPFQDKRLEEMLLRYKARNCPHILTDEETLVWEEFRTSRLLGRDGQGFLTFEAFYASLNELYQAAEESPRDRSILEDLALYAESIYPMEY